MKKVAFFIENDEISIVDFMHIEEGNPGIGGTEYLILLIATTLAQRDNGLQVTLYVQKEVLLPERLKQVVCHGIEDASSDADNNDIDFFVFDAKRGNWDKDIFGHLSHHIKIIPWAHTFFPIVYVEKMILNSNLDRIVCVGQEQRDLLLDHPSYLKTDVIYNAIPLDYFCIEKARSLSNDQRGHVVTYMGALKPFKCFHILAELWPQILKRVPDAELYVIGSGNLYNNSVKLGKYGLAEEEYENQFIKFLTKSNGEILDSVHFMGNLGNEKNEILLKTKVGVPNPTGRSETFCICAVEMQAMGCYVTAMKAPGYLDTVYNGTLVSNKRDLCDSIVENLVHNNSKNYDLTINFIKERFSLDVVIKQWEELFISKGEIINPPIRKYKNLTYRLKWLKLLLVKFKIVSFVQHLGLHPIDYYIRRANKNKDYALN